MKNRKRRPGAGRGRSKAGIALLVVVLAVLGAGAGYIFLWGEGAAFFGGAQEEQTFCTGVRVMGVDLSGRTYDEGKRLVTQAADEQIKGMQSGFIAEGNTYWLDYAQLGVTSDAGEALDEAFAYGHTGGRKEQKQAAERAAAQGVDFDVEFAFDKEAIYAAVGQYAAQVDTGPVDAEVIAHKSQEESQKLTGYQIEYTEGIEGKSLDVDETADLIWSAVESGNYQPVQAAVDPLPPRWTAEKLKAEYAIIGTFETEFKEGSLAKPGRRHNIWQMGDSINCVRIDPGGTWSINEEAGPRTPERGWEDAGAIRDGESVEETGGGICQTSSTLYNAAIRAELEIVEKHNHSWPLAYVSGGLDATISTDWPDFKIRNNKELPIFILVDCDGEGERTIRVSILGPKRTDGMTVGFSAKEIEQFGGGQEKLREDPTLPAGQRVVKQEEKIGRVFQVYKHWYDAEGNEVKTEEFQKVTYPYFPAVVLVGTMPVEQPAGAPAPQPPPSPVAAPEETAAVQPEDVAQEEGQQV